MNEKFSDELISAFLDGELTADEQALVEQMLLDSAQYRRMFDELRALRHSLQALPTYKLDENFAERVLRRAERVMLTSSEPPIGSPPAAAISENVSTAKTPDASATNPSATKPSAALNAPTADESNSHLPSVEHSHGNWHVAVIAVATVAAMLLITFFIPPPEEIGDSRVAEKAPRSPSREVAELKKSGALKESDSADQPAGAPAAMSQPFGQDFASPAESNSETAMPKYAKDEFGNLQGGFAGGAAPRESSPLDIMPRDPDTVEKSAATGDTSGGAVADVRDDASMGVQPAADAKQLADSASGTSGGFQGLSSPVSSLPPNDLLDAYVVIVEVTRAASENADFETALRQNGIRFETAVDRAALSAARARWADPSDKLEPRLAAPQSSAKNDGALGLSRSASELAKEELGQLTSKSHVVIVMATDRQLDSAVALLRSQSNRFPSVSLYREALPEYPAERKETFPENGRPERDGAVGGQVRGGAGLGGGAGPSKPSLAGSVGDANELEGNSAENKPAGPAPTATPKPRAPVANPVAPAMPDANQPVRRAKVDAAGDQPSRESLVRDSESAETDESRQGGPAPGARSDTSRMNRLAASEPGIAIRLPESDAASRKLVELQEKRNASAAAAPTPASGPGGVGQRPTASGVSEADGVAGELPGVQPRDDSRDRAKSKAIEEQLNYRLEQQVRSDQRVRAVFVIRVVE